jgi:hypothetical protein
VPQRTGRNASPLVTIALLLLGLVFVAVGVVYLTQTAGNLPAFFPGHQAGSVHHHTKHGLVAFALAVLVWLGAWFTTGTRTRSSAS